jgi:hypothetical protein
MSYSMAIVVLQPQSMLSYLRFSADSQRAKGHLQPNLVIVRLQGLNIAQAWLNASTCLTDRRLIVEPFVNSTKANEDQGAVLE